MAGRISAIRKKEIKQALFEIIVNEGIGSLSVKRLAEGAGLSEGAIYRHFKSKNAIFLSIADDMEEELLSELKKTTLSRRSPESRLKSFICKHYRYLARHRGMNILIFSLAAYEDDRELLNRLSHIFNLQKKYFCKIITDGMVKGLWDSSVSPEKLSEFYMGIPTTLNIEMNFSKGPAPGDTICLQIYSLLLKILGNQQ